MDKRLRGRRYLFSVASFTMRSGLVHVLALALVRIELLLNVAFRQLTRRSRSRSRTVNFKLHHYPHRGAVAGISRRVTVFQPSTPLCMAFIDRHFAYSPPPGLDLSSAAAPHRGHRPSAKKWRCGEDLSQNIMLPNGQSNLKG